MEPSPTHAAASQPSPPVEVSEAERCHEDHLWTFPNTRPRHPDVFRVALDKWRVSSARPGTLMHLIATRSARGDDVFARDDALKGCVDRLGARFTRNMLVTDTQSVGAPHGIVTRMQIAHATSASADAFAFVPDPPLYYVVQSRVIAVAGLCALAKVNPWLTASECLEACTTLGIDVHAAPGRGSAVLYRVLDVVACVDNAQGATALLERVQSVASNVKAIDRIGASGPLFARAVGIVLIGGTKAAAFDIKLALRAHAWAVHEYFSRSPDDVERLGRQLFPSRRKQHRSSSGTAAAVTARGGQAFSARLVQGGLQTLMHGVS